MAARGRESSSVRQSTPLSCQCAVIEPLLALLQRRDETQAAARHPRRAGPERVESAVWPFSTPAAARVAACGRLVGG